MEPLFPPQQNQNQPLLVTPLPQAPTSQINPYNSSIIVKNQSSPFIINPLTGNTEYLTLSPVTLQCPFCHAIITTEVETSCSYGAVCLCLCIGLLCYSSSQKNNHKEFCCKNAVHSCPNCGAQIAKYNAC